MLRTIQNYLVYKESRKWNIAQEANQLESYPDMNEIVAIADNNFKAAISISLMKENNMLSVNEKTSYQINRNNEKESNRSSRNEKYNT